MKEPGSDIQGTIRVHYTVTCALCWYSKVLDVSTLNAAETTARDSEWEYIEEIGWLCPTHAKHSSSQIQQAAAIGWRVTWGDINGGPTLIQPNGQPFHRDWCLSEPEAWAKLPADFTNEKYQ